MIEFHNRVIDHVCIYITVATLFIVFSQGDLDFYQCSRRILVIIGLINFPELGCTNIETELEYYSKRFPHLLLKRIFLFNYSFDANELVTVPVCPNLEPETLEIFPPDKLCDDGRSMVSSN